MEFTVTHLNASKIQRVNRPKSEGLLTSDVVYKMGGDTFEASGGSMHLDGVRAGDTVVDPATGLRGTVTEVDRKLRPSTLEHAGGVGAGIVVVLSILGLGAGVFA